MIETVFNQFESNVRYYSNNFPTVFATASGSHMTDTAGKTWLDILSGCGTLNYGHNNPAIMEPVLEYVRRGGILHSLDMHTRAKAEFISTFQQHILAPRNLDYKQQFPGPTGTNAIEAAMKLARKVTGRKNIIAFSNGFHGMTLGALAATAKASMREGACVDLGGTTFMPYEGYLGPDIDTLDVIGPMLTRPGSGVEAPAAVLIELVQGEGGLGSVTGAWLKKMENLARQIGALLIIDDIQAGNGRTGSFFSFENFAITPDIVVLSKSLSGFGSPFSMVLLRPELDIWKPGEHNGTFRGNNLAFVGATAALKTYWADLEFEATLQAKSTFMRKRLETIVSALPSNTAQVKGRGLFLGIEFATAELAPRIAALLYDNGVIIETCGDRNQVLKLLPALTIEMTDLEVALDLIESMTKEVCSASPVAVH